MMGKVVQVRFRLGHFAFPGGIDKYMYKVQSVAMITIQLDWSWTAFIVGILSTLFVLFWLLVGFSYRQWSKQRKQETTKEQEFYNLIEEWNKKQDLGQAKQQ